jgi:hypothetical protein
MKQKPVTRSASAILALLDSTDFCSEAYRLLRSLAPLYEAAHRGEATDQSKLDEAVGRLLDPFIEKWGVPPPQAADLIHPDPRRRVAAAVASGVWGLVPVFPWTKDQDVRSALSRIRRAIKKQHNDVENIRRAQLARWLEECDIPVREIAKTVWGRLKDLRRPTKQQAIRGLSEDEETRLYHQYLSRGLSADEAERRIYRKVRGSEVKAMSMVRMAERRYVERAEAVNVALAQPLHVDDFTHAVTMMCRAVGDENPAEIQRWAVEAKRAAVGG